MTGRLITERDDFRNQVEQLREDRRESRKANKRLTRELRRIEGDVESRRHLRHRRESLDYLFIVTYGRSGSTLLQGIVNSIPGYLIRGENRGALYHLFRYHETCRIERKKFSRKVLLDGRHPWFGIDKYPEGLAVQQLRELVLDTLIRPLPDTRVVGFKEIRWQQPDLAEYVAFLQTLFPKARFIFNTRAHEDVAKSKWWADHPNALKEIQRIESLQSAIADDLGTLAYRIRYDDYVADPLVLKDLFSWLGEDFDPAAVRAVLDQPHSY